MANNTPMQITLYDENSEVIKTYSRTFVPWKILKKAVSLAKELENDVDKMTDADVDALAGLVVEVFGNKFSVEDLNDGADLSDMVTVLNTIIGKAKGGLSSPFPEK